MAYKPLPIETVGVSALALDLANYRIPTKPKDEAAALNYLFASEEVVEQVRLFLRDGYFDNEVPIVVKENGQRVVLEGNRRVSALKAIGDPTVAPTHEQEVRDLLTRYASEAGDMPTKIRVIEAPSRKAALPHVARLHTGPSKKRWSRDQQARFYHSLLTPGVTVQDLKGLYPDVDIVRFLRMIQMREFLTGVRFSDASLRDYVTSGKLLISSFEYAYRSKDIAQAIGVTFDGHRLKPSNKSAKTVGRELTEQQRTAVEHLMAGFRDGSLSTRAPEFKKNSREHLDLLAALLGTAGPDPVDDPDEPTDEADPQHDPSKCDRDPGEPDENPAPRPRGPNNPDTLKGIDIGGLPRDNIPSNLTKRILELRGLDVKRTPAATAMLLRSVLEASIKWHFEHSATPVNGELARVVAAVKDKYGKRKDYKNTINIVSNGGATKPGSVQWFNAAAHDPNSPVEEPDVRTAYATVERILTLMLKSQAS